MNTSKSNTLSCSTSKSNAVPVLGGKQSAFTLIELLVVVALIALLMGVLMPALRRARDAGRRTVCLSNVRSLTQAWSMYADENDNKIINANAVRIQQTGPGTYTWASGNPTWVGVWAGPYNLEALEAAITIGLFYPYVKTIAAYKCTNHKFLSKFIQPGSNPITQYADMRIRSYSIVDSLHGATSYGGQPITSRSQIKNHSEKMVFFDRGAEGQAGWSIYPQTERFFNPPGIQHSKGTVVSFADGHSEYWKWEDPRTVMFSEEWFKGSAANSVAYAKDNPDFMRLLRATWGLDQFERGP